MENKVRNINFLCSYEFGKYEGRRYSSGQYDPAVWDRYLSCAEMLTVFGYEKIANADEIKSQSQIDADGVVFRLFNKRKGIPYRSIFGLLFAPDPVVCRSSLLGYVISAVRSVIGRLVVIEVVACPWDSLVYSGSWLRKLLAPLIFLIARVSIRLNKNVVYVTDEFLQSRYPAASSAMTISCSNVELPDHVFVPPADIVRRSNGYVESSSIRIGVIGGYETEYKGQKTLIDAIASDSSLKKLCVVDFVGQGSAENLSAYSRALGVKSRFLGVLHRDKQLFPWLDGLDVYCQPSFQEGLPRSVLEALARGIPVLGSRAGGIPELLPSDNTFSPGDSAALAELLLNFTKNRVKLMATVFAGYEVAKERRARVLFQKRKEFLHSAFKLEGR